VVDGNQARHVAYEPRLFGFGDRVPRPLPEEDIGFAGFRVGTDVGGRGSSASSSCSRGQLFPLCRRPGLRNFVVVCGQDRGARGEVPSSAASVERPAGDTHLVNTRCPARGRGCLPVPCRVRQRDGDGRGATSRVDLAEVGLPWHPMFFFDMNGAPMSMTSAGPHPDGLLTHGGRAPVRPSPTPAPCRCLLHDNPQGFGLMQRNRRSTPTRMSRPPTSAARAFGSNRWATGAGLAFWSRFRPTPDPTTSSPTDAAEPIKAGSEFASPPDLGARTGARAACRYRDPPRPGRCRNVPAPFLSSLHDAREERPRPPRSWRPAPPVVTLRFRVRRDRLKGDVQAGPRRCRTIELRAGPVSRKRLRRRLGCIDDGTDRRRIAVASAR
jgi:hypothetical protein